MPKVDNKTFYSSAIVNHGISAKGLNWNSSKTQTIRFRAILKLLNKKLQDYTLLDAGCGFGDFYIYLEKNSNLPKDYIGVDCHDDMVSIASNNTGCRIINMDVIKHDLPKADYIVCSGALNILSHYESFLFLKNCFNASKLSFVFNVLYGDKKSDTYNYMKKDQIELFAKKLGVKKITYLEGYLEKDITVRFDK